MLTHHARGFGKPLACLQLAKAEQRQPGLRARAGRPPNGGARTWRQAGGDEGRSGAGGSKAALIPGSAFQGWSCYNRDLQGRKRSGMDVEEDVYDPGIMPMSLFPSFQEATWVSEFPIDGITFHTSFGSKQ